MNFSKLIIRMTATLIVYFGIGRIGHFGLFANYYYHNPEITIQRPQCDWPFIILGELFHAFAVTWLFMMIYKQGASLANGLMFGTITGIMTASMWGFVNYGAFNLLAIY